MNYYDEINKKVKDYSKNRSDLTTYYNVGKLLSEAGKHYGEGIINEYSRRLTNELGKGFSSTRLRYMRQFYIFALNNVNFYKKACKNYLFLLISFVFVFRKSNKLSSLIKGDNLLKTSLW